MGFLNLQDSKSEDQQVIVKDDNPDIPTTDEVAVMASPTTFRGQLQILLHNHWFHVAIIALVLTDCILVVCELVLDLAAVENENEACEGGEGDGSEEAEKELTAALVLHCMSIGILSIFLVEITLKLYAFRLEFFKHKLEVFDAVIVIISFVLDVLFLVYEETFMAIIQLLIFLRLWRIVRIINGLVLSVEAKAKEKITAQKHLREEAELELEKLRQHCEQLHEEIDMMRAELDRHGIVWSSTTKDFTPDEKKIDVMVDVNECSLTDENGCKQQETIT